MQKQTKHERYDCVGPHREYCGNLPGGAFADWFGNGSATVSTAGECEQDSGDTPEGERVERHIPVRVEQVMHQTGHESGREPCNQDSVVYRRE